jgi:hypothetical protein
MSRFRFFSNKKFWAREIFLPTAFAGLLGWLFWDWFTATLIGIGVLVIVLTRVTYLESLSRDASTFNGVFLSVNLNNVRICWVPESWFAAAKLKTLCDHRLYVEQILELGKCCLRIIKVSLCLIPVLAFWLAVVLGILSPETMQSVCAAFMKANPASIAHSIIIMAEIMAVVSAGCIGMAVFFGVDFGLVDCFGSALEKDLRSEYDIIARGQLSVRREPEYQHTPKSMPHGPPAGLSRRRVLIFAGIVFAFTVLVLSLAPAPNYGLREGVVAVPSKHGDPAFLGTTEDPVAVQNSQAVSVWK